MKKRMIHQPGISGQALCCPGKRNLALSCLPVEKAA